MGNRNRPTPEFRREAVRLALTSGRTRREMVLADELEPVSTRTVVLSLMQRKGRATRLERRRGLS